MGLPMIQVVMIMARQMSKPVADVVMRYGKNHPLFRNKVLLPVGRGLVQLITRIRMKSLDLGKPTSVAKISDDTALEQASEFVQQIVIFGYTVGVFYAYQVYSKSNEIPTATKEELKQMQTNLNRQILDLNYRVEELSSEVRRLSGNNQSTSWSWSPWSLFGGGKTNASRELERRNSAPAVPTMSRLEAMQIISRTPSTTTNSRNGMEVLNVITDGE